ncbi:uncharacterized protein ColSpa_06616 [Colletotrichum spaethianum]|uniref:Integral membrane protein n=1 Tax=Colletotrichum spaethianum TaxID=700344 RepID=A0AA37LI92_9PEZI|nr:uncharacterized protein ColSpa_06616 [Colletotrichum spaethianum]GKT46435.1 hypothetical protein ColSpa_06616 [Colletotrichum spaethianum]
MPSDSLKSDIHQYPVPSFPVNTDPLHYDITYDLPSTKCLGTFRTMATASSSPAENRPLNPNVVFRPMTPPSHASGFSHPGGDDGGSPKVCATFIFSVVDALRVFTIALSIVLVVLEFIGHYEGVAKLYISLAILQLIWLILALVLRCHHRRSGRRKGFTIDLGFVQCIFGRRGRKNDSYEEGGVLAWMEDDGSKRSMVVGLVYTAIDITFAVITFTAGVVAAGAPDFWGFGKHVGIAIVAIFVGVFEGVIAIAAQFAILKRAKVQIMWDTNKEDDIGSHKYRIQLPQSPEQRHATMSVAA